ncbi:unnamed protein product [Cladocopium goreaui]|uniref:Uncharacterized protein n=1 Tax=Cladocopium goreaui TaxID=2562237 RepID=A0A9P1FSL5_9DINO|nr:unnamed protein product [Cladocopium goreaui]
MRWDRGAHADMMLAGKNRINSLSLENDIKSGNFEGYDMKGTEDRLGSKLTTNYDKAVKPVCEEIAVAVNARPPGDRDDFSTIETMDQAVGGSRTSLDDATKRYLCDRTDLKKKKEEGGEFSYTKAAKEMNDQKLEEMRAERKAEREARLKMFRRPRDQIVTK